MKQRPRRDCHSSLGFAKFWSVWLREDDDDDGGDKRHQGTECTSLEEAQVPSGAINRYSFSFSSYSPDLI